jgi:hypothetical protein
MPLCIWNDSSVFSKLKRAMQEADQHLFRFPNGSASNEYHWNGAGTYDTDSVWIASDSSYKPGWRTQTIHRGSTKADSTGDPRKPMLPSKDTVASQTGTPPLIGGQIPTTLQRQAGFCWTLANRLPSTRSS